MISDSSIASWAPAQQVGTPWVMAAVPEDVQILFWMSIAQAICGGLLFLSRIWQCIGLTFLQYIEVSQKEEKTEVVRARIHQFHLHFMAFLHLLVPILGLCSIKLDSNEILTTSCVVILVGLVWMGIMAGFNVWIASSDMALAFGSTLIYLLIVLITLGLVSALHIVSIIFAWRYTDFSALFHVYSEVYPRFI